MGLCLSSAANFEHLDVAFQVVALFAEFGVVAAEVKSKTYHNGEYLREFTMTLRLMEVGKGAKTELPDNH